MGVFDRIGDTGKSVDVVDSEILGAGQLLIAGMRLTTGQGDPEQGAPFGQSSARFSGAGEAMGSAIPGDEWHGGGAAAYTAANRRQADRTASLAALDRGVQTVIAREAHQVAYHRGNLEDQANYLGGLSRLTRSISLIPGVGKATKTAVELAAVNSAIGVGSVELHQLSREVDENAAQLHALADEYSALADEPSTPPELGAEPPHRPSDDAPEPGPADEPGPGHPAAAFGGAPSDAPTAGPPAPVAEAVTGQSAAPGTPTAPAAMPTEAMSGMASAFGAVGGMIGSVVAPLAAVLTGVAGAAGQSLSTLTSAGDLAAGTETGETPDDDGSDRRAREDGDDDRASEQDTAAVGADAAVPAATGAESEVADPPPADKLDPQRPSPPPAATRPPQ